MRCVACDVELTDREDARKSLSTGERLELCDTCYEPIKDVVLCTDSPEEYLFFKQK